MKEKQQIEEGRRRVRKEMRKERGGGLEMHKNNESFSENEGIETKKKRR